MADDRNELNRDKGTGGAGQQAPGRGANDDVSTGGRTGGNENPETFDREDQGRQDPGKQERDQ